MLYHLKGIELQQSHFWLQECAEKKKKQLGPMVEEVIYVVASALENVTLFFRLS